MKIDREYPRTVPVGEFSVTLRLLGQGDQAAMLALTRSIPERDRLFLRRDVTREDVVERWIEEQERGELATIVAEIDGRLAGYSTVQPDREPWSKHVGELRILVSPRERGKGLGRLLTQEAFALALAAGLEKLTARMTIDQDAAIRTFEGLGFRQEALLLEQVQEPDGSKLDLLVYAHDVAGFHAMLEAYGVAEALGP